MMGDKNRRRKCECVLEYTKMKSDEMPHVNICRVTEAHSVRSGKEALFSAKFTC